MINRSRQLLRFCFLLSDLVLTTVAWFAAAVSMSTTLLRSSFIKVESL